MKRDSFVSFILFIIITSFCFFRFETIDFSLIKKGRNVWFQSDSRRYYKAIDDRKFDHRRSNVHPFFSSIGYFSIKPFTAIGFEKESVVKVFYSLLGGFWVFLIYCISKKFLNVLDSILLSVFCFSSATFQFSHFLIETFLLGSISLLLVLFFGFFINKDSFNYRKLYGVFLMFISASITITNSMLALIVIRKHFSLINTFKITFIFGCILLLLSLFQNYFFSDSLFILNLWGEKEWLFHEKSGSIFDKLLVIFFYSISIPKTMFLDNPQEKFYPMISIQRLGFDSLFSLSGAIALFFFSLITFSFFRELRFPRNDFLRTVSIFLGFQIVLHIFYGDETFLYSFHWVPFLAFLLIPLFQRNSFLSLRVLFLFFGILNLILNNFALWDTVNRLGHYNLN